MEFYFFVDMYGCFRLLTQICLTLTTLYRSKIPLRLIKIKKQNKRTQSRLSRLKEVNFKVSGFQPLRGLAGPKRPMYEILAKSDIRDSVILSGPNKPLVLKIQWTELHRICGIHRPVTAAPQVCLRYRYVAAFRYQSDLNAKFCTF